MALQRDPLPIIKEYLAASDRQVRKNAVVAMAALETQEAVVELVRTAVKDQDADTRRFAEEEILQLPADSLRAAARELGLELSDAGSAGPAYALLGRIRAHGIPVELPPLPMKSRLRLARSLVRQLYPARGLAFRFRAMRKSSLALVVAVTAYYLISIGLFRVGLDPSGSVGLGLLTTFVGSVLAFSCTQRVTAIGLQPDPKVAIGYQAGMILLYSFFWILLVAGLPYSLSIRPGNSLAFIALLVLVPVACVLVRLATISAIATTSGGWLNRYGPVMAGGCAGCVLITAGVLNRWLYGSSLISDMWAILVPSMFGLAAGFATIDQSAPTYRVTGRIWQKIAYGAVIVFGLAIALASRFSSAGPYSPGAITDSGKPLENHRLLIVDNPTVINLTLNANQRVGLQLFDGITNYCNAVIADGAGTKLVVNPVISHKTFDTQLLSKGTYKLTVTESVYQVKNPADVLKTFNDQLMQRFGKQPHVEEFCTIELTLNRPS